MSFGIHHKKLLIQKISILGIAVGGILDLGSKADISMQMVTFEAFFVRIFPLMQLKIWMDCYRLVCIPRLSYNFITSSIIRHQHLCGEDVNPVPNRKPILDAFALTILTGCHFLIEKAKIGLSRDHVTFQIRGCEMSRKLHSMNIHRREIIFSFACHLRSIF